jgi:hypothetical protein
MNDLGADGAPQTSAEITSIAVPATSKKIV